MTALPSSGGYGSPPPGGSRKPTGRRRPPYIPGFDPGSRGNEPEIYSGRGGGPSAPGMGGGFGMPGMGGGGMSMPGMGGMGGGGMPGMGGTGRTSGYDDKYSSGGGGYNPRPGDRKPGTPVGGGNSDDDRVYGSMGGGMGQGEGSIPSMGGGGMSGGFGGTGRTSGYDDRYSGGDGGWNPRPGDRKPGTPVGGGNSDDDRVYRGPSGSSQSAGGFGGGQAAMAPNSGGSMDIGGGRGATSVPGGGLPGQGFSGWTRGSGGGGGATTPNRPPPINQPPTMNTPTGGMPPAGGPPAGFGGTGVRYPDAGSDAARQKSYQSNTGGMNMPGSPMTPPVNGSYQFNNTGGGQTVPNWGNTIKRQGPTNIYGGNTSTFNMTQQGDQFNQGQNMKRLANKRRAAAAKAPQQRKTIGSTVNQNLQVMRPGMRYS